LVTVTVQVPDLEERRVSPLIEQWALPALVTAYVTAPVPDPPDDVKVNESPLVSPMLVSVSVA
jgi:hypothetical protein